MIDTKVEYYFSKNGITISLILVIVISTLLACIAYILYQTDFKIAGLVCLCIFFLFLMTLRTFYRRLKFLLTKTPALVLTKEMLVDNINNQKYKWTDIKSMTYSFVMTPHRTRYIAISLFNPEKYLATVKSPYKRFILRLNRKYFNGTFSIQPSIIRCDGNELVKTLNNYKVESI